MAENPTQGKLHEEQEFLYKIFSSQILRKGYEFLQNHYYVKNLAEFRDKVHTLWFELYDRDGNSRVTTLGSRYVCTIEIYQEKGNKLKKFKKSFCNFVQINLLMKIRNS